jgi:predicted nucleic acid-binding protein
MWSETRSALHEGVWRGDLDRSGARAALDRLERSPVEPVTYPNLGADAWDLADLLGCAKTYDAEYLALARHLRCLVVTLDERLRRGAERLGLVVGPNEL